MRSLIVLALWIAVGFGLTALAAIELECSQTAKQQATIPYDRDQDTRRLPASEATTP